MFWPIDIPFEPPTCHRCEGLLTEQPSPDQLLSEGGIDLRVTRRDFRSSVEQACGICVPYYESMQERFVPPRVLIFGRHQMYWQCQTGQHWEGGNFEHLLGKNQQRLSHEAFLPEEECDEIRSDLRTVDGHSRNYSTCQLTVSADRLPALSAIATRFPSVLKDTYYAGLGKDDLKASLSWTALPFYDNTPCSRPSEYRAPTCSWVSIHDDIGWWPRVGMRNPENRIVMPAKVVSCDVQLIYPIAPFGEIHAGTVELRGPVIDIDWDGEAYMYDEDGNYFASVSPDLAEGDSRSWS